MYKCIKPDELPTLVEVLMETDDFSRVSKEVKVIDNCLNAIRMSSLLNKSRGRKKFNYRQIIEQQLYSLTPNYNSHEQKNETISTACYAEK